MTRALSVVSLTCALTCALAVAAGCASAAPSVRPADAPPDRARGPFVIVPGTGCGAATYERLAAELAQQSGRPVHVAVLAGMGERTAELTPETVSTIDANAHARDVADFLVQHDLRGVTLVGHSYGGMPMTGAVGLARDRVARLVYVDAYVPVDGDSVFSLDPSLRPFIERLAADAGDPSRIPPFPAAHFLEDAADRAWFARVTTAAPLAMYQAPVHVDDAALARVHRGAVAFTQFGHFRHAADEIAAHGGSERVVNAKHMGVHTHARETAAAILAVE